MRAYLLSCQGITITTESCLPYREEKPMREIKFRAWDKRLNYMIEPFRLQNLTFEFVSHPDNIFLQYTGLRDKNGVGIYEGDILRWYIRGEEEVGEVRWQHDGWGIEGFWAPWQDNPEAPFSEDMPLEVIGNIWENPELLGETND